MRRSADLRRAGAVLAAVLLLAALTAPDAAAHMTGQARNLAGEVCEDMVRGAVVAAADQRLRAPQYGSWNQNRYTCSYDFTDGKLTVSVDVFRDRTTARRAFAAARRMIGDSSRLYGIGQQAAQGKRNAMVIARKDNFLLVVDPTGLGPRIDHDATAWSATRAVFDCW